MKLYIANTGWRMSIEEKEVLRVSESSYWVLHNGKEHRSALKTQSETAFYSWQEAKDHLVSESNAEVEKRKSALKEAESNHEKILSIQPC